jgi:hypothetical protein
MQRVRNTTLLGLGIAVLVATGCGGGSKSTTKHASGLNPADFSPRVDNPWFPLKPGTTFVYKGTDDKGKPTRDVVHVTSQTKDIGGLHSLVVDDRVYDASGRVGERTHDYYAQDKQGTVWYTGEDTAEYDSKGHVTTREGTWHNGVNGGRAGVFMPAHPRVGERHRQEYLKNHAEDIFQVLSLTAKITTPTGSYSPAIETKEFTRLEPGIVGGKWYAKGVGQVAERTLKGDKENLKLVSVRHG